VSETEHLPGGAAVILRVLSAEEHEQLPVPAESLLKEGRPDIYPELIGTDFLQVYLKRGELVFQTGGWVGLLHVNPTLAIEVRPRVPIANLEHIIALSGSKQIKTFERFTKDYIPSAHNLPSIVDAVATGLLDAVDALVRDGLHYEYRRRTYVGSFPRGRIDPALTALHRLRAGRSPQSVHHAWERTRDVPPNQYVRAAVRKLLAFYEDVPDRKGRRGYIARLRRADRLLGSASALTRAEVSGWNAAKLILRTPAFRDHYPTAVGVSEIVLGDLGVEIRSPSGQARLPAILINMNDVFEGYVRAILRTMPAPFAVMDGNLDPPSGARKRHITSRSELRQHPATPDIVVRRGHSEKHVLVADVKYKPAPEFPERDDLNQVVTYAVSYDCHKACIFYPRKSSKSPKGLADLGKIGHVSVYQYVIDLNSSNLIKEEQLITQNIKGICEDTSEATGHRSVPATE
jgi:5-methylcytosine-specific restriction enzyme subunit McrC